MCRDTVGNTTTSKDIYFRLGKIIKWYRIKISPGTCKKIHPLLLSGFPLTWESVIIYYVLTFPVCRWLVLALRNVSHVVRNLIIHQLLFRLNGIVGHFLISVSYSVPEWFVKSFFVCVTEVVNVINGIATEVLSLISFQRILESSSWQPSWGDWLLTEANFLVDNPTEVLMIDLISKGSSCSTIVYRYYDYI